MSKHLPKLLLPLVAVAFAFAISSWLFRDQNGRILENPAIPTAAPKESLRVLHPDGFSVVSPAGWDVNISVGDGKLTHSTILLRSCSDRRRRVGGCIWETVRLPERPNLTPELTETEFLGSKAWAKSIQTAGLALERPPEFRMLMFFEKGGAWYAMQYTLFDNVDAVPKSMWEYLSSFETGQDIGERGTSLAS